ncbi:MAG TPA: tetratricopeptide repeat protein [Polyangia bacterium]
MSLTGPGPAVIARTPRLGRVLRVLALLALCAGGVLGPAPASAQEARPKLTEAQKQEVRDRYEKATRYYYLRKYPEAIAEYEGIYLLSADPVMLYNIAQCHRQSDDPEKAAQFYRNYLRNAPAATNRADVEKKIAEMDKLLEERRRSAVTPGAPGTAPGVPPVAAPPPVTTPPPVTPPGPVTPDVGAPPPARDFPSTTPPPVWSPPPGVNPPPAADVTQTVPAPSSEPSRVLRWSLVIGGGVFLTTAIVTGAVAATKAKEIGDAAETRTRVFDANLKKTEEAGRTANGLAIGTGVIGLAALGAGIYLWKTEPDPVAPTAYVVPAIGPGYAGALAKVGF